VRGARAGELRWWGGEGNAVGVIRGCGGRLAVAEGRRGVCGRGHGAMGAGGRGVVRAGLIGGWMAQQLNPFGAACLGVWLQASAGQKAGAGGRGLAASDIVPATRQLLVELRPSLI
ncbi:bifunctional ADP-dependent NAD(P)H-hydrate dehydratase/NAD(P)H-hydrate epimerase, partial [Pseudomonas syringae]